MWRAGAYPSSTFGLRKMRMAESARLFLCAHCRMQVVLCSRCDRGNRYCGRVCRRHARDAARRETARRYQRSQRGRAAHAQRARRWRQRAAARASAATAQTQNVTHQGCSAGGIAAPLAAWTHDSAISRADIAAEAPALQEVATTTTRHCRRCAALLPGWLRQGFVRHAARPATAAAPRGARRHDHFP